MVGGKVLSFIEIFVDPALMDEVVRELSAIEDVTEVYEVTGEFDVIIMTRSKDMEEFRDMLKNKIMKIKGIKTTVSSIVMETDKGPKK
jgi:DNA-binding Lrp family transcriptional regulator